MVHRPVQSVHPDNRDRKDHPVHQVPMVKLVALVHREVLATPASLDLMDNLGHPASRVHKDNQDHRAVAIIVHHRVPDLDSPQNTNNYLYSRLLLYSLEDTHHYFCRNSEHGSTFQNLIATFGGGVMDKIIYIFIQMSMEWGDGHNHILSFDRSLREICGKWGEGR